ncbi:hypothetical protein [Actinoplanes sp. TFC3]|uniref:hypothetical protein n=1 Tax=Actinoplanes sp. TFC3 TaxID=1710355 RepID=UPI000AD146E7|nr:hypothetical protein [Actinoplanes sp. TFC3]
MREEFQTIEWAEPPIGDLIGEAVATGRRLRTAKRLRVVGAGLAVLVVTGLAAIPIVRNTTAPATAPAAIAMAAPSAAASSSVPAAVTEANRVKGTPAGVLELLTENLPKGKTSHYAGVVDQGDVGVQTYLDRGKGPGMIRLFVMKRTMAQLTSKTSALKGAWIPLGNGVEYQSINVRGNCIQHTIVYVRHADDTLLQFNLSNCLAWDGKQNGTSPQILTVREAAEVGADPRWGVQIDPSLNQQGAATFPHLPANFGK